MDPVYTIKRKRQVDINKLGCLFCNNSAGDFRIASSEGKERTCTLGQHRRKLGDTIYADVLQRLEDLSEEQFYALEIRWHKGCYSSFSLKNKIITLRKQHKALSGALTSATPDPCSGTTSGPTTRSSKPPIN